MTTYAVEGQQLTNIADAIRSKTGGVDTMSVDEMPVEIEKISVGCGVVSWNDIEDKPFGNYENKTAVMENATCEFAVQWDYAEKKYDNCPFSYTGSFFIKIGKTYAVEWDGQTYLCQAIGNSSGDHEYAIGIGNMSLINGTANSEMYGVFSSKDDWEDTGEPFALFFFNYYTVWNGAFAKTEGEHTFSIYLYEEETEKLDVKFIPWLVVEDTGWGEGPYRVNMTYDEAVELYRSNSLIGGCIYDMEGMKLFTHIGDGGTSNYLVLHYEDGELMFDWSGVHESMPM